MGRSVNYLVDAQMVTYIDGSDIEDEIGYSDFVEDITEQLLARFPSLYETERWDNNETKIIVENALVEIGVSEYAGLVSISARAKDNSDNLYGLGVQWLVSIEKKFQSLGDLRQVGRFSNGECVFERS